MPTLAEKCPACGEDLITGMAQHCADRPKPCGWVKHRCGAVVDPRGCNGPSAKRGRHVIERA